MKLAEKIAIVTGSTQGIGAGIARELARCGATVVVTSRDENKARLAVERICSQGGKAHAMPFNLENTEDLPKLIGETVATFKKLDILVNNAVSANTHTRLLDATYEQIQFVFNANITHTVALTQLAYPHLKLSKGNIINITSVVCNKHLNGIALYAIIKGALLQMTRSLASEWSADGIRVNAISPGFVRTQRMVNLGISDKLVQKNYDHYRQFSPLGIGTPEDIAKMAVFLASDDAAWITGSVFNVDGGYSANGIPMASVDSSQA